MDRRRAEGGLRIAWPVEWLVVIGRRETLATKMRGSERWRRERWKWQSRLHLHWFCTPGHQRDSARTLAQTVIGEQGMLEVLAPGILNRQRMLDAQERIWSGRRLWVGSRKCIHSKGGGPGGGTSGLPRPLRHMEPNSTCSVRFDISTAMSLIVSSEWRQLSCRRYSEPIEISLGKDADGIAAASAVMMASRLQALDSP